MPAGDYHPGGVNHQPQNVVHFNGNPHYLDPNGTQVQSWSSSAGAFQIHEPASDLKKQIEDQKKEIEALKEEVAALAKRDNEREDVAYFQRNMYSALKMNPSLLEKIRDLNVGPNDVLILHVRTSDVPSHHIERYLRKIKEDLKPVWSKVGLDGRLLCMAGEEQGFSVIHVERQGKPHPPVMG